MPLRIAYGIFSKNIKFWQIWNYEEDKKPLVTGSGFIYCVKVCGK